MKLVTALLLLPILTFSQSKFRVDNQTEMKISEIISKMTIEEKVGQMTQVTLEVVGQTRVSEEDEFVFDEAKLREAILKYKVGSILNTGGAVNSVKSWQGIITKIQEIAIKESRLHIPILYGVDAIHGANYTKESTLFPQAIAMGATRNREFVRKAGEITALDVRNSGISWNFNPVLDMGRQPLWPRFYETFGESVYLTSILGEQYILGLQNSSFGKESSVASCLKHYLGYSNSFNGLDRTPIYLPERQLREIYLPPFAKAVNTGSMTVMVNSSEINGIPVHSDKHIITEILKEELGFEGLVVSDWEDIIRIHTRDGVAETPKEAVKYAVMAGLDMSMVPYNFSFYEYLVELVKDGEIPISRIDDAVRRILRVKFALGLFENAFPNQSVAKNINRENFDKISLEAAMESITLLKNDNSILPISKKSKVLVTGTSSNLMQVLNGGWSYNWQGNNEKLYPQEKNTLLEAIEKVAGKENVIFNQGITFEKDVDVKSAIENAKNVDYIILALGEPAYCETPGNIHSLELDEIQINYTKELAKTGKPIILVLLQGRPRLITKIVDNVSAVFMAYLPGNEGGDAIAKLLFGDGNPSGVLPFTYPKYQTGNTLHDYKPIEKFDVNYENWLYPFGFGLSYSTFQFSNLKINGSEFNFNQSIKISVDVTNIGKLAGKKAVDLYVRDVYGSISRPVKELKGFDKVNLNSGETKTVEFVLTSENLSFIGRENQRIVEPGEFQAMVGDLVQKFMLVK